MYTYINMCTGAYICIYMYINTSDMTAVLAICTADPNLVHMSVWFVKHKYMYICTRACCLTIYTYTHTYTHL